MNINNLTGLVIKPSSQKLREAMEYLLRNPKIAIKWEKMQKRSLELLLQAISKII